MVTAILKSSRFPSIKTLRHSLEQPIKPKLDFIFFLYGSRLAPIRNASILERQSSSLLSFVPPNRGCHPASFGSSRIHTWGGSDRDETWLPIQTIQIHVSRQ